MKHIEVGQFWRTRSGEVVRIVSRDATSYPFNLAPRSCVTADGREFDDGRRGGLDLMRQVHARRAEAAQA